ncbi:MAG: hypothetical protein U0572_10585 [Phycisphaerales bacterium]
MTYSRTGRSGHLLRRVSSFFAAVALFAPCGVAVAQTQKVLEKLNEPWQRVQATNQSWKPILTAYLDMTKPPSPIGPTFELGSIWPKMDKWPEWSAWAEKNAAMGKALIDNQTKLVFGMPYGEDKVDAAFKSRGLYVSLTIEPGKNKLECGYLAAIREINAYAVAEMWRLGEAGKFDDAFKLGLAHLRVLRQLADQTLLEEKTTAMLALADSLSVHRDYFQAYLDKISSEQFQKLATKEYSFLRPADNERLKRLEMPEGDRWVSEAILRECFDDNAQPSPTMFAQVFADMQSSNAPLERFGAVKRWNQIAALHGSLESSLQKLNDVYDDWWRRWRTRQYDSMLTVPTEFARLNRIRYAAVVLAIQDLQDAFALRRRLVTEINGTVLSAGICGYYRGFNTWPNDIERIYTAFAPKKFDFDPYDKEYGRFIYKYLGGTKRTIETVEWGPVTVDTAVLYARNDDHNDDGFRAHSVGGASGDFVVWPPLRQLARTSGGGQ